MTRPARVKVRYLDQDGARRRSRRTGLLAACLQHEIDHLDGILFVDHLSGLKRNMILRRLAKEHAAEARQTRSVALMRLAFMGSPDFAVPALRALHAAGHEIAAVYCQPPRPAGRGQAVRPCPVHVAAERLGLAGAHAGAAAHRCRRRRRRSPRSVSMRRWSRRTG